MSTQKVIFLYCSPEGERYLQERLAEAIAVLPCDKQEVLSGFFSGSLYKQDDECSIRVWFNYDLNDFEVAFLCEIAAVMEAKNLFFARIGEKDDDFDSRGECGSEYFAGDPAYMAYYSHINLPANSYR